MVALVFANSTTLLFMPQTKDAAPERKARAIAVRLGLEYQYRFSGCGGMEAAMRSAQDSGSLRIAGPVAGL